MGNMPALTVADLTSSKLIAHSNDFPILDVDLEDFLALNRTSVFVGQFGDDLMGRRVDRLPGRWPTDRAIDAERHPARLAPEFDTARQLGWHDRRVKQMHR